MNAMRSTEAAGESGALSQVRLNAAVRLTVEKLQPDVIVLFGSAARNTMREGSDIDLLVLRDARGGEHPEERYRWWCPATGDDVDVVRVDRETLRRENGGGRSRSRRPPWRKEGSFIGGQAVNGKKTERRWFDTRVSIRRSA